MWYNGAEDKQDVLKRKFVNQTDLSNSKVKITIRGKRRTVYVGNRRDDGNYQARLRAPYTESSIRGVLRVTKQGLRFVATHPDRLNCL